MQTANHMPLVPEFTCQGHLITALDTLNLRDISILEAGILDTLLPPRHHAS